MIKRILIVFLLMFSGSVFADTYPAIEEWTSSWYPGLTDATQAGLCSQMNTAANLTPPAQLVISTGSMPYTGQCIRDNGNGSYSSPYPTAVVSSCPAGGTVSGTTCINAPACATGQYRNSGGQCTEPVFCLYPEVDNGSGACGPKPECGGSQEYNFITHSCATPPVCGATERLNPATFACNPNPLQCPGHSHASTANDKCLADPALTCPIGQHDDGAYNCVANDAPAPCNSKQQKGYIDGIPQCIPKPNLDTAQQAAAKAAADSKTASDAKSAAVAAAKVAADKAAASAADAAANPNDTTKATTAANDAAAKTVADSTAKTASDASDAAKVASDKADNDAKNGYLKTIADESQAAADRANSRKGGASSVCSAPPTCSGDAIECALLQQSWSNSCKGLDATGSGDVRTKDALDPVSKTVSSLDSTVVAGSCPAAQTFVVQGKSMSISYQFICDYGSAIKYLVLALAWLGAGFIVFGSVRS